MPRKALVLFGGIELHQPRRSAEMVQGMLSGLGFETVLSDDPEILSGRIDLAALDIVIPVVTGGILSREAAGVFADATEAGLELLVTMPVWRPRFRLRHGSNASPAVPLSVIPATSSTIR